MRKHILLVEDNQDDEELTLLAFEDIGIADRVLVARDGAEAIDILFGTSGVSGRGAYSGPNGLPSVIFLDLKLPKISGMQVLKRLKSDPVTKGIPVVILTSSRENPDIAASYELGANSYIVKPIDTEQFTAAVHQLGLYWLSLNNPPV